MKWNVEILGICRSSIFLKMKITYSVSKENLLERALILANMIMMNFSFLGLKLHLTNSRQKLGMLFSHPNFKFNF